MKNAVKSAVVVAALGLATTSGIFVGVAIADQPHMRAALDSLKDARDQLAVAEHNKAGHREEALRLTDAAIREVRAGIDAGEDR